MFLLFTILCCILAKTNVTICQKTSPDGKADYGPVHAHCRKIHMLYVAAKHSLLIKRGVGFGSSMIQLYAFALIGMKLWSTDASLKHRCV